MIVALKRNDFSLRFKEKKNRQPQVDYRKKLIGRQEEQAAPTLSPPSPSPSELLGFSVSAIFHCLDGGRSKPGCRNNNHHHHLKRGGSRRGEERDLESNPLNQPLLKRSRTLSSNPLAIVGAKVSHIESLDYEINENDLFKHDWRSRSSAQVLQYIFLKWSLAFLVGLLTGLIATLINLAVENIAGYKLLAVSGLVEKKRYLTGFIYLTTANFVLTLFAAFLCVCFAPTAAGPGIPEIKAYLNGVDTPNMFGASTLIVKIFGSIGAVSAGLDLGKEGPLVHIGSCIASLLGQGGPENYRIKWRWLRYFNNDRDRRDLITCGASSGVCAAFRAPVGGVLFSLEEVATWWRSALLWRTFFSTAVVAVVLRAFIEYCNSGKCGLFGRGGLIMFDVSDVTVTYHAMDIALLH
ncbi:Chloride channel protein CLC-b [Vitis vinifera]|uniref:Chloride channel protein CLC-b n=1 Tax=Vitis vinifera TaxID=29760 RepID=A0A438JCW6_VITVI|nr:Chloride channel protein CLC-b [Vitis vinifera]